MRSASNTARTALVPLSPISGMENVAREVHIPPDYHHQTLLCGPERLPFYRVDPRVTDDNFKDVTTILEPGSWFRLQILYPAGPISFDDGLKLVEEQGGMLVGAHGLVMLRYAIFKGQLQPIFRENRRYFSFDWRTALPEDKGNPLLPYVVRDHRDNYSLELASTNLMLGEHDGILVFTN